MKNQVKHKYVPCDVNVTEFNVERGFAQSSFNAIGTNWIMNDAKSEFKNEQYEQDILDWSDKSNNLPSL